MCNDLKEFLTLMETYKNKLKDYGYSDRHVESIINSLNNLNRDDYVSGDYVSLINSLVDYANKIKRFDEDNFNRLKAFCISLEAEFNTKRKKYVQR